MLKESWCCCGGFKIWCWSAGHAPDRSEESVAPPPCHCGDSLTMILLLTSIEVYPHTVVEIHHFGWCCWLLVVRYYVVWTQSLICSVKKANSMLLIPHMDCSVVYGIELSMFQLSYFGDGFIHSLQVLYGWDLIFRWIPVFQTYTYRTVPYHTIHNI